MSELEIPRRDQWGKMGGCKLWEEVFLDRTPESLGRGHRRTGGGGGALTCQLPGGQPADGSVLSPSSAHTLDLTWCL